MFDDTPQPTTSKKAAPLEDIFSGISESAPNIPMPTQPSPERVPEGAHKTVGDIPVPAPTNPPVSTFGATVPAGLGGNEKFSAPPTPQAYGMEMRNVQSHSSSVKKMVIIAAIVVLVIVAAVLLSSLIMRSRKAVSPVSQPAVVVEEPDVTTPIEDLINSPAEIIPDIDGTTGSGSVPGGTAEENLLPVDSDRDGLVDDEEMTLGTSPRSADTDSDGLSDKDEVKAWGTNPLNPDTDGDGYKDGDEVDNGYDPKGPGKLFEVPS